MGRGWSKGWRGGGVRRGWRGKGGRVGQGEGEERAEGWQ